MKSTLPLLLLLTLGSPLRAQESCSLSLDEAIDAALRNNPAMRAANEAHWRAEQERRAAIGLRMPQIALTGTMALLQHDIGFDFNNLKAPAEQFVSGIGQHLAPELQPVISELKAPLMGADWSLTIQPRDPAFVAGEVAVPLWMGGRINAANRVARLGVALSEVEFRAAQCSLISEVTERYFGLKLALAVEELCRAAVAGIESHLKDALALERNGLLPHTELLYVRERLSDAERDLKAAEFEVQTLRAALANTLGEPIKGSMVTPLFMTNSKVSTHHPNLLQAEQSPQLQEVELQREMAHEGVRAERAKFLPEISAFGVANLLTHNLTSILPRWAVGIGLRWRLFDGLNREYKYAAARSLERQVEALQAQAQSDISLAIEELRNRLETLSERFRSFEASLTFADEYLRSRRIAFREGACNSSQVIDAELALKRLQTERMECAYHYDNTLARLLELTGTSDQLLTLMHQGEPVHIEQPKQQ